MLHLISTKLVPTMIHDDDDHDDDDDEDDDNDEDNDFYFQLRLAPRTT